MLIALVGCYYDPIFYGRSEKHGSHMHAVIQILKLWQNACMSQSRSLVSGTIIRGTLKTPNSQLVTPISIKLQRPDGYD
jgi:hypothetical protein